MLIGINKIKVDDRIRKDYGNIEELANDIKENGLINPPVVTPEYKLIAGERRLRAMKYLGYEQVEVRVMTVKDYEHQLKLEISENENRKEFTFSERIEYARKLEEIERGKARERQGARNDIVQNFAQCEQGKSSEIVANKSGFGNKETYRQAKYISDNADDEMIKSLDEGKLSINKAYNQLKQAKKEAEEKLKQAQQEKQDTETRYSQLQQKYNQKLQEPLKVVKKIPEDYEKIKSELEELRKKRDLNEKNAEEYKRLQKQIEHLKRQRDDFSRELDATTELSGLVVKVENFLKNDLSPIKYSRAIHEQKHDEIVQQNLKDIVNRVHDWCDEMYKLLDNKNYIDVEVEENGK